MTQSRPSRRKFPRIPSACEVGVRPASDRKDIPMVSTTHDVGTGGCRFVSKVPYGVGTELWLTIFPKKGLVEARGRVAYERLCKDKTIEVGVEFLEISDRDKATLEKLLAAKPQEG